MSNALELPTGSLLVGRMRGFEKNCLGVLFPPGEAVVGWCKGSITVKVGVPRKSFAPIETSRVPFSPVAVLILAFGWMHPDRPGSSQDWSQVLTALDLCDVPTLRRAAFELSRYGAVDDIHRLPLTENERSWWSALACAHRADFVGATSHLERLPPQRYSVAIGLRAAMFDQTGSSGSGAPSTLVTRLWGAANAEVALRTLLRRPTDGLSGLLVTPDSHSLLSPGADAQLSARQVWHHLTRPESPQHEATSRGGGRFDPRGLPLSVVDELVDRGLRVSDGIDDASARHARGRSELSTLTDGELRECGFATELARRALFGEGNLGGVDLGAIDPEVSARVRLRRDGDITDVASGFLGREVTVRLRAFLEEPTWERLDESFLRDPSLWVMLAERLADQRPPVDSAPQGVVLEFRAWFHLRQGMQFLFDAKWSEALAAGRAVLQDSSNESVRDEALNVMACAHWQMGNPEAARSALATALKGRRNTSLQVNLGVVAAELDPEAAALELARLVRESSTVELRSAAAMRAAILWWSDASPWRSEESEGMPVPIRDAFRDVVKDQLDLETFRQVLSVLADFDSEWLAKPRSLASSPHRDSVEARVFCAKARGFDDLVNALVAELKRSDAPLWVREMSDSMVAEALTAAIADSDSGAAWFALDLMERGVPVSLEQKAKIVPLAVHAACQEIDPEEGYPNDRFLHLLGATEREWQLHGSFSLQDVYDQAWNELVAAKALHLHHVSQGLIDEFNAAIQLISGRSRNLPSGSVARQRLSSIWDRADAIDKALSPLPRERLEPELREFVSSIQQTAKELRQRSSEVMR